MRILSMRGNYGTNPTLSEVLEIDITLTFVESHQSAKLLDRLKKERGWTAKREARAKADNSLKIAKSFLADGDSLERVGRNTGLPLAKVKALLKTTKVKQSE